MNALAIPSPVKVAFWMGVSAVAFACLIGAVRHLGQDMHVLAISFWRFFLGLLLFAPWFMRVGRAGLKTQRLGLHLVRSGFLLVSSISIMTAVLLMPLDEATALSFTTPLFAVIGAVLFLKEKAGPRRWIALAIGFLGMLIILRPGAGMVTWAAFLVVVAAVTFAAFVLCGKVLLRSDSPELLVVLLSVIAVPLAFAASLFYWQWPTAEEYLFLAIIAVSSNLNMYGIAKALQHGDASAAQPYDFLRLPTTAAVGWFAFSEPTDLPTWIGALIIFASTIYITRREAVAARHERAGS